MTRKYSIAILIRGTGAAASILVTFASARLLSTIDAGIVFTQLAIVIFGSVVVRFGSDVVLLRNTARGESVRSAPRTIYLLRTYLAISVVLWLLLFLFFFAVVQTQIDAIPRIKTYLTPDILLSILFHAFATTCTFYIQGAGRTLYAMASRQIAFSATFLLALVAQSWMTEPNSGVAILLASIVYAVQSAAMVFALARRPCSSRKNRRHSFRQLVKPLMFTYPVSIAGQVLASGPVMLVATFAGSKAAATFAVPFRIAMSVSLIFTAINTVILSDLARSTGVPDRRILGSVLRSAGRTSAAICVPIFMFLVVFGPLILGIFGTEYSNAYPVLIILCAGQLVNVLTGSVASLQQMSEMERSHLTNVLLGATVLLVFALSLIPIVGGLGAAIATSLGVATQNIAGVLQVQNRMGLNIVKVIFSRTSN